MKRWGLPWPSLDCPTQAKTGLEWATRRAEFEHLLREFFIATNVGDFSHFPFVRLFALFHLYFVNRHFILAYQDFVAAASDAPCLDCTQRA
ncbi:MAG: hypothetical protein ABSA80_15840 [Terriglobales bacterium]|jgi:hypothetical protein